ncbi:hypothetical protein KC349_g7180 [Hortaea werneckii]|nr:hypothetical protein KC349_g7180 [Hortaea werneckii]
MQPPNASSTSDPNAAVRPPASPEFLLAFLALTARFHPKLVAHHSPATSTRSSNPLIASEYYAAAANERLVQCLDHNYVHDIERCQASLMLGLHEWGMCRGSKAWIIIGMAIRAAQAMGLQYERDLDDEPMSRSRAVGQEAERLGMGRREKGVSAPHDSEEDMFIRQEVRRRTFWSCYIMDRYLSSGKYRPQMLHAHELRIQLPASERSFLFAEKVRTLMLGEDERKILREDVQNHRQQSVALGTGSSSERNMTSSQRLAVDGAEGRLEAGPEEGLVSRYVKILEIYGRVVTWSCSGGRRTEQYPPWDPRCQWHNLRQQCLDFKASLPRQHTLTPQNTQAHITLKTSTPYTLMHTVYLLCQIMLHREYVPFVAIRCARPQGPLDPPLFPSGEYSVPAGFWDESARECFRSAREIMDLVGSCQEWNALVETPIVGFAIYTVAFVGVYCINFPWMDPEGYMCSQPTSVTASNSDGSKAEGSAGFQAAKKALEIIGDMRRRLNMAHGWFSTIKKMHKYFVRLKKDYKKNTAALNSSDDESGIAGRNLSLREGGEGGGLEEWKILERTLTHFGSLDDQDIEMADAGSGSGSKVAAEVFHDDSSVGTADVKSEDRDQHPTSREQQKAEGGPWNAINSAPGAESSRRPSLQTPSSAQFRSYDSFSNPSRGSLPPPQPSAPAQHYPQPPSNYRSSYSADTPGTGTVPSLTSPASYSASTPSQTSPPFERQPSATGWTPQGTSYPLAPMQQQPYTNGYGQYNPQAPPQLQQLAPLQAASAAHPPSHPPQLPSMQQQQLAPPMQNQYPQQLQPAPPLQEQQPAMWDNTQKEQWLDNLQTRMSADDLAAFVDGGDISDWASRSDYGQAGWLATLWGGADS